MIGGALVVRDGVVDGDIEGLVLLERLVGGVGWIERPIASGGVDGETVDGSADELIAQNSAEIRIIGGELAADGGCIFCGALKR